jgi:hypothetical protein
VHLLVQFMMGMHNSLKDSGGILSCVTDGLCIWARTCCDILDCIKVFLDKAAWLLTIVKKKKR